MRRIYNLWIVCSLIAILLLSCSKIPLTHRRQMRWLPEDILIAMSLDQYPQITREYKEIRGTAQAETVQRVAAKLVGAAQQLIKQENMEKGIKAIMYGKPNY